MAALRVDGPGKTAPKLLADFLQFDPQKNVGGNLNILTSHPPAVGEGQVPTPHRDACKHEYTVKVNQSVTPPLDSRPDSSTLYKLAVVCKRCRLHTDIRISYQQASDPCPTSESQLHHFQRASGLDSTGTAHITYGWQCSSSTCHALLTTTFKMGKISNADRNLLTDTSKLKSRFEAVMQDDPEREGIRQATPVEALTRLRKYIRDALNTEHDKRVFPANNKRFMEAYGLYGRDCKDLLQRLGFEFDVSLKMCAYGSWTNPRLKGARNELEIAEPTSDTRPTELNRRQPKRIPRGCGDGTLSSSVENSSRDERGQPCCRRGLVFSTARP